MPEKIQIDKSAFGPKLFQCLRTYRRGDFLADLIAGITVGLVALPPAMAFGIASGVTPRAEIYTAMRRRLHRLGAGRFEDPDRRSGRPLILCGARRQPATCLRQAEFVEHIGRDNIQPHVEAALTRASRTFEDLALTRGEARAADGF